MSQEPETVPSASPLPFRIAFFLVAGLILGLAIALPFAAQSLFFDLFSSVASDVYAFDGMGAPGARGQIHASVTDLDESRLKVTLRVSGHRTCQGPCPFGARLVLFSLWTSDGDPAGMPPSAKVDLPITQTLVTESVDLPIHGHPTLYPFDTYDLWLGIGLAAITPDGTIRPLTREEASGMVRVTLQEQLPREQMDKPVAMSPTDVSDASDPYQLQGVEAFRFYRPLHERVLAVLLVLLVAAAAAYAVFMRPLHDLVINSGGLVLGVWGIRSLLTPGTASRTLVDLALSLVILFLLGAITFRAVQFLYVRGGFRRVHPDAAGPPSRP
ncbi:MAG: hypothetical protein AB7P40_22870 [Chloroflexota bacterium]